jgi:predicted membrane protein
VILIVVGGLLFLDNLDVLPFGHLRSYWPLAITAWGFSLLSRARNASCMVWHWVMIVAGILLTMGNLGILHISWGSLWPLFLIAAGVSMLLKRSGVCAPSNYFTAGSQSSGRFHGNLLQENAIFSSVNRRVESQTFEGADLNSTFGELKIDLRGATISTPNRQAIVETNAAFGAIKLRIPETWKVVVQGTAVFGAYEDKTFPPRPVPGVEPPTLIIRGSAAFGAVEIEN